MWSNILCANNSKPQHFVFKVITCYISRVISRGFVLSLSSLSLSLLTLGLGWSAVTQHDWHSHQRTISSRFSERLFSGSCRRYSAGGELHFRGHDDHLSWSLLTIQRAPTLGGLSLANRMSLSANIWKWAENRFGVAALYRVSLCLCRDTVRCAGA